MFSHIVFNDGTKLTWGIGTISNSTKIGVIIATHDPEVFVIDVNSYWYFPGGKLSGIVYVKALLPAIVLFPLPVRGLGKILGT